MLQYIPSLIYTSITSDLESLDTVLELTDLNRQSIT